MFTSKYFRPTGLNPFAIAAVAALYYLVIKSIGRGTTLVSISTVHECLYLVTALFVLIALANFLANLAYSENEWRFLERNIRAQLGPIDEEEEEEEASYSETDEEEEEEEDGDSSDSEWLPYQHRKGTNLPSPPRREKNPEMFLTPAQVSKDIENYHTIRYKLMCYSNGDSRPTSHVGLFEKDAEEKAAELSQMTGFEFRLIQQE